MTAKSQTNWSPEKLEEWARPALANPQLIGVLIEIARTATSNNQAKNQVLEWVGKSHEDLARACRWLHILWVKYPERFEKLISQAEQNPKQEEKEVKKQNREISILVDGVKKVGYGRYGQLEAIFEFKMPEAVISAAIEFLDQIKNDQDLVERMVECVDKPPLVYNKFMMRLIQILEEKYGLKVKICENCRSYRGIVVSALIPGGNPKVVCLKRSDKEDLSPKILSTGCEQWELKEVLEKK